MSDDMVVLTDEMRMGNAYNAGYRKGMADERELTERKLHDMATWARADERAHLHKLVKTLGGYIRKPDEYVPIGMILMLLSNEEE